MQMLSQQMMDHSMVGRRSRASACRRLLAGVNAPPERWGWLAGDFGLDLMSEPQGVCVRDDPPGIHQERGDSFKAAGCMLLSEAQAEGETPDFVMATPEELEDTCDLFKLHTAGIAEAATLTCADSVEPGQFLLYSHDWKVDGSLENATPVGSVPVTRSDYSNLQDESERPTKRCCKTMLRVGERAPVFEGICYGGEVLPGGEDVDQHLTRREGLDQHHGGGDLLDQQICVQNFLDGKARAGVSRDFGLRRERQAPNRMIANTWGGDKACRAAAHGPKRAKQVTDGASSAQVSDSDRTDDAQPKKRSWDTEEAFLIQQYLAQGVKLDLCAQTSVINKKIDIFLPRDSGFSRSKFFKAHSTFLHPLSYFYRVFTTATPHLGKLKFGSPADDEGRHAKEAAQSCHQH